MLHTKTFIRIDISPLPIVTADSVGEESPMARRGGHANAKVVDAVVDVVAVRSSWATYRRAWCSSPTDVRRSYDLHCLTISSHHYSNSRSQQRTSFTPASVMSVMNFLSSNLVSDLEIAIHPRQRCPSLWPRFDLRHPSHPNHRHFVVA